MANQLTIPMPTLPSATTTNTILTYLGIACAIGYAIIQYRSGAMDLNSAAEIVFGASGLGAVQHKIGATNAANVQALSTAIATAPAQIVVAQQVSPEAMLQSVTDHLVASNPGVTATNIPKVGS